MAAFLVAGCGDESPISSPTGPSPIAEVDQYSGSPAVDGNGLGTDTLPKKSVPGTTPLTASFRGVPPDHDDSPFSFVLDLSEDIAGLSYQTLRDNAFTVTHGTVTKAGRQAPPSNQSWNITINPDAGESVEITLPATTDCSALEAICTPSGRMLSNHTSATVAPPNTGAPTGRTSATVQFQDTAIDPGSERSVTIALNQTGTIPARASVEVALSGNAVSRLECIGRQCEKLKYNSWAGTYTVPLSDGASTTFRAVMNRPLPREASSTLTLSSSGLSIGANGVMMVSAAAVVVPRACNYQRPGGVINSHDFAETGGTFNYYIRLQTGCGDEMGGGTYGFEKEETATWVSATRTITSNPPCGTGISICQKYTIQVQPNTGPLPRRVRVRVTFGPTNFPWFTVTQPGRNAAPTVAITCASPPCDEAQTGGMITFQAVGSDPNNDPMTNVDEDPLTYEWTTTGGGTLSATAGESVTWTAPTSTGPATVSVVAKDAGDLLSSPAVQRISVIQCVVATGRADVTTGFPAAGALTDKLYFVRNPDRAPCQQPTQADFKVDYKAGGSGWITTSAIRPSTETGAGLAHYTHYFPFTLSANTSTAVRRADIYVDVGAYVRKLPIVQSAADPADPVVPANANESELSIEDATAVEGSTMEFTVTLTGTRSGNVTVRYSTLDVEAVSGSDYTATSGVLTFTSGDDSETFTIATREDSTNESTERFAVRLSNASAASSSDVVSLADRLAYGTITDDDNPPTANVSLAVGTSGDNDFGYRVYLHFGNTHAQDLSYGDNDYGSWGLSDPTWDFSPDESATVDHPTLTESTRYPGIFTVSCAATNGHPSGGFSVSADVMYGGTTKSAAADHAAPDPEYTKICMP